jgi:hypothetical protein
VVPQRPAASEIRDSPVPAGLQSRAVPAVRRSERLLRRRHIFAVSGRVASASSPMKSPRLHARDACATVGTFIVPRCRLAAWPTASAVPIIAAILTCPTLHSQCVLDLQQSTLSNESVRLRLPEVGSSGPVSIEYRGQVASADHWYYCVTGGMQSGRANFRSRGKVVAVEPLETGPERAKVRLTRLTDEPDEPDLGTFELVYELLRGRTAIHHEMTFTPQHALTLRAYEFFVASEEAGADTHRLHFLGGGWQVASMPAQTSAAYGRIAFPCRHPWAALENVAAGWAMAVGTPPADVRQLQYAIDFKRFEFSRTAGHVGPKTPLHDFALIAFGEDVHQLAQWQREFESGVVRPPRDAEPELPRPDLSRPARPARFERAVDASERGCRVTSGGLELTVDRETGALRQLEAQGQELLTQPGGVVFIEWPDRKRLGPEGAVSNWRVNHDALEYEWTAGSLTAHHTIGALGDHTAWTVEVRNGTPDPRLLEVRFALPLRLADEDWYYWDGLALRAVDGRTSEAVLNTLVPGEILSQGVFPATCLHNGDVGVALGMAPMQIESFYGAQVSPATGALDTYAYTVRWALPPGTTRSGAFVLYAIEPQWSWRSCIDRYWRCWPEVFAAPSRDDIWGLYAASSPPHIHSQGDKFIERCRRLRVGGMELYAPFNKTGDFYPDAEPMYVRGDRELTADDMRALYETANIASCNLSYVIPTKCEREMAQAKFADSVIRLSDGSMFLRDAWDVMGGGREKLAGMFAWGNAFGESLRSELRKIVANYSPDGFYLDNGAFVWQDYGRQTEWAAFDDEGRVYTNGGIPYAKLLDDLKTFAPEVQRNPGEFIQYFSGFRGQSHLTNIVGSQTHYIRSHRLIMGHKPIFPGHPDRIGSKADLYDMLEFGGLPWLVGLRPQGEAFAQAWAPIAIALARAGWQPIPDAAVDDARVRVERFGEGEPTLFTVRNLCEESVATTLHLRGLFPELSDFLGRADLRPVVKEGQGITDVEVGIPAGEMLFLTSRPRDRGEPRTWPHAPFLAEAQPTSIVLPPEPSTGEQRTARRIKGFIEVQAELLGKPAAVEIVSDEGAASHPNRVLIRRSDRSPRLEAPDAQILVVSLTDEGAARELLSDYYDTIAVPLSDEPPRWRP